MQDLAIVPLPGAEQMKDWGDRNLTGLFSGFSPMLYTGWIFKIVKSSYTTSVTQFIMWIIIQSLKLKNEKFWPKF